MQNNYIYSLTEKLISHEINKTEFIKKIKEYTFLVKHEFNNTLHEVVLNVDISFFDLTYDKEHKRFTSDSKKTSFTLKHLLSRGDAIFTYKEGVNPYE